MNFDDILAEAVESIINEATPAEEAERRGLQHVGGGNYADASGNVVARSRGGRLVPVKGDQEPAPATGAQGAPTVRPSDKSRPSPKRSRARAPGKSPIQFKTPFSDRSKEKAMSKLQKAMRPRYRRRFRMGPGVIINASQDAVGTSIGTRGLQLTTGKKGAHLHMGIPGTGLYKKVDLKNFAKSMYDPDRKQNFQFRRRVNLGKGTYMNLSRTGIGARIGVPGMNLTAGPQGLMLHLGIPGSGAYRKFKILNNPHEEDK